MHAMMDAICENCGARIGWSGSHLNQPACPKCGRRPHPEILAARQLALEEALAEPDPQQQARDELHDLLKLDGGLEESEAEFLGRMSRADPRRLFAKPEIARLHEIWGRLCA